MLLNSRCDSSYERLVQSTCLVQVNHSVSASFTRQVSLITANMSPFQLSMAALGVVDDTKNIADPGETDVVDSSQGDFVLSLNIHCA